MISEGELRVLEHVEDRLAGDDTIEVVGFASLVRASSASLLRRAFLLTGDRHLAEDLVQTALAKVATRWSDIAAKGDPLPYVRTVVVRTAIGWRRRKWSGEVPSNFVPELAGADSTEIIGRRERLRRALLSLPPRQRAVLVLRFYDDLTEWQTAEMLRCSVGTVKSQAAKGLARLRQTLPDEALREQGHER